MKYCHGTSQQNSRGALDFSTPVSLQPAAPADGCLDTMPPAQLLRKNLGAQTSPAERQTENKVADQLRNRKLPGLMLYVNRQRSFIMERMNEDTTRPGQSHLISIHALHLVLTPSHLQPIPSLVFFTATSLSWEIHLARYTLPKLPPPQFS
ncbi:hypothetical protein EYF80_030795 [Liparis tanakae]|uniref:Uncharacterized protein n=1 Tax=Liparis tanakae TaxID=230148 RepID=A0A4Z2H051_9TELE|nr:hypothetical protein EYF80_030795 [Liparis tanakae]